MGAAGSMPAGGSNVPIRGGIAVTLCSTYSDLAVMQKLGPLLREQGIAVDFLPGIERELDMLQMQLASDEGPTIYALANGDELSEELLGDLVRLFSTERGPGHRLLVLEVDRDDPGAMVASVVKERDSMIRHGTSREMPAARSREVPKRRTPRGTPKSPELEPEEDEDARRDRVGPIPGNIKTPGASARRAPAVRGQARPPGVAPGTQEDRYAFGLDLPPKARDGGDDPRSPTTYGGEPYDVQPPVLPQGARPERKYAGAVVEKRPRVDDRAPPEDLPEPETEIPAAAAIGLPESLRPTADGVAGGGRNEAGTPEASRSSPKFAQVDASDDDHAPALAGMPGFDDDDEETLALPGSGKHPDDLAPPAPGESLEGKLESAVGEASEAMGRKALAVRSVPVREVLAPQVRKEPIEAEAWPVEEEPRPAPPPRPDAAASRSRAVMLLAAVGLALVAGVAFVAYEPEERADAANVVAPGSTARSPTKAAPPPKEAKAMPPTKAAAPVAPDDKAPDKPEAPDPAGASVEPAAPDEPVEPEEPPPVPYTAHDRVEEARRVAAALESGKIHSLDALLFFTPQPLEPHVWLDANTRCRRSTVNRVGQWRLPTVKEARKLRGARRLKTGRYWTTNKAGEGSNWVVKSRGGRPEEAEKTEDALTVCVRKRIEG